YQSIHTECADPQAGKVKVTNRYQFKSLDFVDLHWTLRADGEDIETGVVSDLWLKPGETAEVTIPFISFDPLPGIEYYLDIGYLTNREEPLVPEGYEVAWEQFPFMLVGVVKTVDFSSMPSLSFTEDAETIQVGGEFGQVRISRITGDMDSLVYKEKEYLVQGPMPDFWRAPTDNDFGSGMPERLAVWKTAGLNRKIERVTVSQIFDHEVQVEVASVLPVADSRYFTTYRILGSGDIFVRNTFLPGDGELPELPRIGMTLLLPERFSSVTWYGRGPHESYCDRKTGARVGVYNAMVMDLYHPYIRPQENGNRTDTRWVAFTAEDGSGLLAVGMPLFDFSAFHFLNADFDPGPKKAQRHTYHLKWRPLVSVDLDYGQMGVGGDTSWGERAKPHPAYTLYPKEYSYTFRLRPFAADDAPPRELAKLRFDPRIP
ncbi:MAG: DUF4981 domain-containing protein, partial [Candidatus Aminicenantes bacterium]|nr:DUF4981 domain-containing protein [Candidatus Aminicenantes bacterium]